jgi:threonine dehydratase
MVTAGDVEAAARRLDGIAIRTPLFDNDALDAAVGGKVLLKAECLQQTGSFKIRGAYNRMSQLTPAERARGVVAFSSGNHAQGVARAARLLGMAAAIVMPDDAPRTKLDNTRALGGEVVTYDRATGDREAIAAELAARRKAALVPAYDHPEIIAGQGTIGLEIAEQARELGHVPDQVLIPCGGGGLSAGCALALTAMLPGVAIVVVEPEDFDDTLRSLASNVREQVRPGARSICDALQATRPGAMTLPILRACGAKGVSVSDAEVRAAMHFAFRNFKLVVEPGGAAALAALLAGKVPAAGRCSAIVLSGGNVDPETFAAIQAELS